MTPDTRRAWRTVERVLSALIALGIVAAIVALLKEEADWLGWIAMTLLGLLILREFMVGSENVAARINFKGSKDGVSAELDSEAIHDGDSVTVVKE